MNAIRVKELPSGASFQCSGAPIFDREVEAEVAGIWSAASADQSRMLRDNEVLTVMRSDAGAMVEAAPVPYRYLLAQMVRPDLFNRPLKALAITGIVICEQCYLFGRRAEWLSQDPGMLELVPSGTVDADVVQTDGRVDLHAQFDREITEELGITADDIAGRSILGLVDDDEKHVMDVVMRATLTCSFGQLEQVHSRLDRPEYSSLHLLASDELQEMIADGSDRISAVSSAIFSYFCR